jgi:hypothetical protein
MLARAFPARPWRVFRLGRTLGQTSDHPRQHRVSRCLRNPHASHKDYSPGEQLDAIRRNCVAFCVADGLDPLLSRLKPRLFGSCPRHSVSFGNWRNSRRTRCNLNGGSGFCRFLRSRAVRRGRLLRRSLRYKCAAICAAALRHRLPGTGDAWFRRAAASHHVVEVVLPRHQVVLRCHLRRVSQPLGNHVGRILLNPARRTRRPEVLEESRP